MNKIVGLFREKDIQYNSALPPDFENPGGGVSTKVTNIKKALPHIKLTSDIKELGLINIIESLWFYEKGNYENEFFKRIEQYKETEALKIIWLSDLELFRFAGQHRKQIIESSSFIAASSRWFSDLFKGYAVKKSVLLCDPIDPKEYIPLPKKRRVIASSYICLQKNVSSIIEIFKELKKSDPTIERVFIGSSKLWGLQGIQSKSLEKDLKQVCTHIASVSHDKMKDYLGESFIYLADTRFDVTCETQLEAMLCGCWSINGNHLMYDERPVQRFSCTEEAVEKIMLRFENSFEINEIDIESRNWVIENHSLSVFKQQLVNLVNKHLQIEDYNEKYYRGFQKN